MSGWDRVGRVGAFARCDETHLAPASAAPPRQGWPSLHAHACAPSDGAAGCRSGEGWKVGRQKKTEPRRGAGVLEEALSSDLLSHGLSHTTIGAGAFHFRVRDGIGWDHAAITAEQAVQVARLRGLCMGSWDVTRLDSHASDARRGLVLKSQCCAWLARRLGVI